MMKKFFPYIVAAFVLGLDQWVKIIIRQSMFLGESVPVIGKFLSLTYIENEGVAFGLFSGHTTAFILVSLLILIGLIIFAWKENSQSLLLQYGVALVVSGALGNIIDRALKASVTDMFDVHIWPIFNIADIAVCIGFFLLVLYLFFGSEETNEERNCSHSK